jgi:uncharacterized DUF497 family protein
METPIMFVVIIVAARWIVQRLVVPSTGSIRFAMGFVALGLLLVAEFTLVLQLRGLSISEYLHTERHGRTRIISARQAARHERTIYENS